nr:PRC-barrel domain-containing protein [Stenotrophomonas sp. MMGLT7]
MKAVAAGWSVKKQVVGKTVYNEKMEKIGTVEDIIVTPERSVSYAIVGAAARQV